MPGAVAQTVVAAYAQAGVTKAWINNGGDIALVRAADALMRIGVVSNDRAGCHRYPGCRKWRPMISAEAVQVKLRLPYHRHSLFRTIAMSAAPRANEIVVAVVVTDSGRPLARIGGLPAHEAVGVGGLG